MKKNFLTLMIVLLAGLAAKAATKYEINVGGVEVTSDNCSNVTGGDIESGIVSYNPTTKVLTLNNVTIKRKSGSGNFALHNRSCAGLRVKFVGDNYLYSKDGPAIKVNEDCGLILVFDGGENTIVSDNNDAFFVQSKSYYPISLEGYGHVNINSNKTYGLRNEGFSYVHFGSHDYITLNVDMYGPKGAIKWNGVVGFRHSCVVKLKATTNSSYPVITCSGDGISSIGTDASIKEPPGAVVSSDKTTINYNGSPVYNQDIVIAGDDVGYVATINARNFPDANFRDYLLSLYPKGYITETDINNCTSLDLDSQALSNLTGIEYFTALQSLSFNDNSVSSVNLSANINLKEVYCRNNDLTYLNVSGCQKLEWLNCKNNLLTSISLPPASNSVLEVLSCSGNKFSSLNITGYSTLENLEISNNTSLKNLNCSNNNLYFLSLGGNTALTTLDVSANPFGYSNSISDLADCTALKTFYCYNTDIINLNALKGMKNLEYLDCSNTKISNLDLKFDSYYEESKLKTVDCYNNPKLQSINVYGNSALANLSIVNCPLLTSLDCTATAVQTLNLQGCTALTRLDCWYCSNLTSIYNLSSCTALEYLDCDNSSIYELSAVSNLNNLKYLDCSSTKISSLNVSGKTKLETLVFSNCPNLLTVDCSNCTALTWLRQNSHLQTLKCYNTKISELNLQYNTAMTYLDCHDIPTLTTLTYLGNCTALKELYCQNTGISDLSGVSSMTNLEKLNCSNTSVSDLSALSDLNKLKTLSCSNTKITELTLTNKSLLTTVECSNNPQLTQFVVTNNPSLKTIDIKYCTAMKLAYCYANALTSLNVTGNSQLIYLMCFNNKLTTLSVNGCNALKCLYCYINQLSGSGMTTLVNSLPTRSGGNPGDFHVFYNANELNTMTAAQVTIAKNKYWTPMCYNGSSWVEYTGQMQGDVNGDGNVDVADVTALIAAVLNGNYVDPAIGDINGDGNIDVADATMLISRILNGN